MTVGGQECPEHVWSLMAVVRGDEGPLFQMYECERPACFASLRVGPDDVPPGSPDFPG